MATYNEILSQVRTLLGDPHPDAPNQRMLWESLARNAQLLFNQALNTPVSWGLRSWVLQVQPSQNEYLVTAADFGKDVLIHTIDPTDANHVERPVRRMSFQSAIYGGRDEYVQSSPYPLAGTLHTVQTMAFYRDGASVYIKILPGNVQAAQSYKVWYEPSTVNADALGNDIGIPAGVPLLCIRTAMSVLPATRWLGLTEKENAERRREYGLILGADKADHEREWRKYIATDRQAGITVMRGFDDDSYRWSI